jgi:hypothetical protein
MPSTLSSRPAPPPLPSLSLPAQVAPVRGNFWRPNPAFIHELALHLQGQRVLEIFAGNGCLAAWLTSCGVHVTPTSLFTGHDSHELGLYSPVEELDATRAVLKHGRSHDVLLICWPTVTRDVLAAALLWGEDKDIVFLGEMTDYSKNFLGGCATDEFFEAVREVQRFTSYRGNLLEVAMVCRVKGESA